MKIFGRHCAAALATFALMATTAVMAGEPQAPAAKSIDVGLIVDKKFQAKYYVINNEEIMVKLQASGLKAEIVDSDILLKSGKEQRARYKRLAVFYYFLFNAEALAGIDDYVKGGGLLVTNSHFAFLDVNSNHICEDEIDKRLEPQDIPHGIFGHSSVQLQNIESLIDCPLTKGLQKGVAVPCNLITCESQNVSATVAVDATAVRQGDQSQIKQMPVVAYRNVGNGAFVYLGIPGDNTLLKNSFSPETLAWLTSGE